MNIVFMGTPDFSVPSLEALIKEFDVKAVLTQTDKPKGRGKKMTMSPVKEVALKHSIPVYQPKILRKEKDIINELKNINPDFIIVVAFGQILSKEVLDIPKYACINLHASLLPKYRGAAPINFAVINGEKKSGNTTMIMDEGLDTGDMLLSQEVEIDDKMTAGDLYNKLKESGAELLVKTIKEFKEIKPKKQDNSKTCMTQLIKKSMANINWNKDALSIHNLIRGLNPTCIAFTNYKDMRMKIYESEILNELSREIPGTILNVDDNGIKVACKEGVLLIKKIQFPNKKPLMVKEFIKGNNIEKGEVLK